MATDIPESSRMMVKLRERFRCARCGASAQHGHWHHRRSRRVKDEWQHHWTNGVWLCGTCHLWVHDNGFLARKTGFSLSQWEKYPANRPIQIAREGWVRLTISGGYEPAEEDE
jgi:hypothetical protein